VTVRGRERRPIFRTDADRADVVRRLAALVDATGLTGYAGALLPTHAHLLVRTGQRPLARCMRALLTGYAGAFNRRHHRGATCSRTGSSSTTMDLYHISGNSSATST